jgi:hypothetical protein
MVIREAHCGQRLGVEEALVRDSQHGPVEAGIPDQIQVARVGHHGRRLHGLDAGAQVGRAQLFGARLRDRADAPAGEQRVRPLGPVAHDRRHHVAGADAPCGERARHPRGAVRHLAERDLAPLALASDGDEREA